jgi:hypothetical protein
MENHLVHAPAPLVPGPEDGGCLVGGVGEGIELAARDLAHGDQVRAGPRVKLRAHRRLAELLERAVDQEEVQPARDGHGVLRGRDGPHADGPLSAP